MKDPQNAIPHGVSLLHDPLRNKGTAFTENERDALGLRRAVERGAMSANLSAYFTGTTATIGRRGCNP